MDACCPVSLSNMFAKEMVLSANSLTWSGLLLESWVSLARPLLSGRGTVKKSDPRKEEGRYCRRGGSVVPPCVYKLHAQT